jgi:predicted ArsR family transcriptional regulator
MDGDHDDFDERVAKMAALGEPIRRALYRYVAGQPAPVDREQAAVAVGVARHVAKFHLDRLESDGLLEVEYSRPPGRRGPGAGRPAKRYRRSAGEVSVSLPERRYDLAGHVLAQAVSTVMASDVPLPDALRSAATTAGQALGEQARGRLGHRASTAARREAVAAVLADYGYEPRADGTEMTLANCPFHSLAQDYTELVCGLNCDLIDGLLETVGRTGLRAHLRPAAGRCCVVVGSAAHD